MLLHNNFLLVSSQILHNISIQIIQNIKEQIFSNFDNQSKNIYNERSKHKVLNDTYDVSEIKYLKEELKQDSKDNSLKNQGADEEAAALSNQGMQFDMLGMDIYDKYINDKEKLEVIDEIIVATKDNFQKIEQTVGRIYATMITMLKSSEHALKNLITQLNNKYYYMIIYKYIASLRHDL